MYSDPPLIKTTMSPTDIIGGNLQLLTDHCKTWWSKNEHNGKENVMAAKILGRLRDHGYSVSGTDAYGNLEFSVTLQSKVDQTFQPGMKELVGRSQKELSEIARTGFKKIAKINDDWRSPTDEDIEYERFAF